MNLELSYAGHQTVVTTADAAGEILDRLQARDQPVVLVVRRSDDDQLLEIGVNGDRGFVHRTIIQGDAACWSCQSTLESGGYHLPTGEPAFAEIPYAEVRAAVHALLAHAEE